MQPHPSCQVKEVIEGVGRKLYDVRFLHREKSGESIEATTFRSLDITRHETTRKVRNELTLLCIPKSYEDL
jgi:hypothetical protein